MSLLFNKLLLASLETLSRNILKPDLFVAILPTANIEIN